jgi:hypothetical protein
MKKYIIAMLMLFCTVGAVWAETYNQELDVAADDKTYPDDEEINKEFNLDEPPNGYPDLIRIKNDNVVGKAKGQWDDPISDNSLVKWVTQYPEEGGKVEAKVEGRQAIGVVYYVSVEPEEGGGEGGEGESPVWWADVEDPTGSGTLVLRDENDEEGPVGVADHDNYPPPPPELLYCGVAEDGKGDVTFTLSSESEGPYWWDIVPLDPSDPTLWTGPPYEETQNDLDPGEYTLTVTGDEDFERQIEFTVGVKILFRRDGWDEGFSTRETHVVMDNDGPGGGRSDGTTLIIRHTAPEGFADYPPLKLVTSNGGEELVEGVDYKVMPNKPGENPWQGPNGVARVEFLKTEYSKVSWESSVLGSTTSSGIGSHELAVIAKRTVSGESFEASTRYSGSDPSFPRILLVGLGAYGGDPVSDSFPDAVITLEEDLDVVNPIPSIDWEKVSGGPISWLDGGAERTVSAPVTLETNQSAGIGQYVFRGNLWGGYQDIRVYVTKPQILSYPRYILSETGYAFPFKIQLDGLPLDSKVSFVDTESLGFWLGQPQDVGIPDEAEFAPHKTGVRSFASDWSETTSDNGSSNAYCLTVDPSDFRLETGAVWYTDARIAFSGDCQANIDGIYTTESHFRSRPKTDIRYTRQGVKVVEIGNDKTHSVRHSPANSESELASQDGIWQHIGTDESEIEVPYFTGDASAVLGFNQSDDEIQASTTGGLGATGGLDTTVRLYDKSGLEGGEEWQAIATGLTYSHTAVVSYRKKAVSQAEENFWGARCDTERMDGEVQVDMWNYGSWRVDFSNTQDGGSDYQKYADGAAAAGGLVSSSVGVGYLLAGSAATCPPAWVVAGVVFSTYGGYRVIDENFLEPDGQYIEATVRTHMRWAEWGTGAEGVQHAASIGSYGTGSATLEKDVSSSGTGLLAADSQHDVTVGQSIEGGFEVGAKVQNTCKVIGASPDVEAAVELGHREGASSTPPLDDVSYTWTKD